MDVDTFKIRLTALPFLSKADVASYQQRVQQGRLSPETIFREAVRVNKQRKAKEIVKKKREFRFMIADIGLDFWDRRSLIRLIDENTVIRRLKARADKLVKIREREDVGKRRARLTKFLTGLKLDQTDKFLFPIITSIIVGICGLIYFLIYYNDNLIELNKPKYYIYSVIVFG